MERQHYNRLASSMWHIEKLAREMEAALSGGNSIYESIEADPD